ncbi:hypothetical protein PV05_02901 [Exophiala xenobiotica]|uniref:Uncharacterized protein n=1 Tax=Exophiala xenobiotica TaxID=348802 RepID=A0A0D2ERL2_9EURO|nr:uncharacterized protein PV05_02901 [Exophiala xenobiotica]KIW58378.1 hypothetical protein PV05_02901 [Exophiala xenobiotica]
MIIPLEARTIGTDPNATNPNISSGTLIIILLCTVGVLFLFSCCGVCIRRRNLERTRQEYQPTPVVLEDVERRRTHHLLHSDGPLGWNFQRFRSGPVKPPARPPQAHIAPSDEPSPPPPPPAYQL